MRQINILYIITGLEIGGAERLLVSVIRNLNREKYKIVVCFLKGKGPLANEIRGMGVKVLDMKMRARFDLSVILKLVRLIKRENIDLVHTHLIRADILGALAAKLAGVPIIISTRHSFSGRWEECYLVRKAYQVASNFMDKIITVSEAVKDRLAEWSGIKPDKMIVIHNGVDVGEYKIKDDGGRRRDFFDVDAKVPLIGMVSRLVPCKGHKYFLEAAARVKKDISDARFLIVGGTMYYNERYKKELTRYAEYLGLNGGVLFTGIRRDIPQIMSCLDIFVLPSIIDEAFGRVVLEAMACGRPVIATNGGGIPEIVKDNETGMLVPPKDSDKLAQAIIALLEDKERAKRMGLAGRERVEQYFSLEKMVKKIEDLYGQLINSKVKIKDA